VDAFKKKFIVKITRIRLDFYLTFQNRIKPQLHFNFFLLEVTKFIGNQ